MSENVDFYKQAIIAEIAADVLHIKDMLSEVGPLTEQLRDQLPGHFDVLRAGLIETLSDIDEGIKEAGGERIDFVKGQLHVFIEQAIDKAFSENSEKVEAMVRQFERQNQAAAQQLKVQFDAVASGMQELRSIAEKARFPTWAKVIIPLGFIVAIIGSAAVSWQMASYKEALYMKTFMELPADKRKSTR